MKSLSVETQHGDYDTFTVETVDGEVVLILSSTGSYVVKAWLKAKDATALGEALIEAGGSRP